MLVVNKITDQVRYKHTLYKVLFTVQYLITMTCHYKISQYTYKSVKYLLYLTLKILLVYDSATPPVSPPT